MKGWTDAVQSILIIASPINNHHQCHSHLPFHSVWIQSIQLELDEEVPIDIYTLLHSNQNTDKLAVARKKILQTHSLENVEFALSSLPNALSSVGNTDSKLNLSQLYGIFRRVPHIIQKNPDEAQVE